MGQQRGQHRVIGQLLGKEEYQVVNSLHLLREDGFDGNHHIHRAHNMSAAVVQFVHVGLVSIHQLHRAPVFCEIRPQDGAHGSAAKNRNLHTDNPLFFINTANIMPLLHRCVSRFSAREFPTTSCYAGKTPERGKLQK